MARSMRHHLRIFVPAGKAEALREALSGPRDFWVPAAQRSPGLQSSPLSAHEKLLLRTRYPDAADRLRALGRPDFLEPLTEDTREFLSHIGGDLKDHPCAKTAALSCPKFRPFADRVEYGAFLLDPGSWRRSTLGAATVPEKGLTGQEDFTETHLPEGILLSGIIFTEAEFLTVPTRPFHRVFSRLGASSLCVSDPEERGPVGVLHFARGGVTSHSGDFARGGVTSHSGDFDGYPAWECPNAAGPLRPDLDEIFARLRSGGLDGPLSLPQQHINRKD